MADLRDPRLIYLKGLLFLLTGLMASALLLLEDPTAKVAFLLAVAVWSFARYYYFAFYVIEHYIDPSYRFAGLGSFLVYLLRRRRHSTEPEPDRRPDKADEGRPPHHDLPVRRLPVSEPKAPRCPGAHTPASAVTFFRYVKRAARVPDPGRRPAGRQGVNA